MDDWEEDAPVSPILKKEEVLLLVNRWADEDVDENEIKDSWEDEEEEEPTPAPAPLTAPAAEKSTKKSVEKADTKKGKTAEVAKEEVLDPAAEKVRQQRLVEQADFKSTTELFGKGDDEKSLDNFIPKSESDFLEYAELISHKLRPYEKSYHYMGLLKMVMRLSMTSLTAAEVKEIGSSVMTISNEKLKAEKEAIAGKKKTAAKKKQLHVDKADDEKASARGYDDSLDDYDFM